MPSPSRGLAPADPSASGSRAREWLWLGGILAITASFYLWTATTAGNPLSMALPHHDLYARLTEGFVAGQTSFLETPPAELGQLANPYDPAQNAPFVKYHDVTYFQGRYYLYFGPTPVVVLLAPWKLITGTTLPQHLALVVFAWGAVLGGVLVLRELRNRFFPTQPSWMLIVAAAVLAWGSLLPVLLRRPLHYELAIASACCCALAALWFLLRAENSRRRQAWLAGAGLTLGLAVAARPNYVFAVAAVFGCWAWHEWRTVATGGALRTAWRAAVALAMPFGAVMVALLTYNYVRFGSVAEFGTSYMLAGSNQQGLAQLGLRYVPINLYYYLAAPPHLGAYFPFLLVTGFPPFTPPPGYSGQENMYGLLVTLPFLWTAFALWPVLRRGAPPLPWQRWARCAGVLVLGLFALLTLLMGAANRYQLDFVPVLSVLAVLGFWHLDGIWGGWRRILLRFAWIGAGAWAIAFCTFVSLQHNELLRFHNPDLYAKIARMLNGVTEPLTGATREAGPLRLEVKFPLERTGKLEPLVVTGVSFRADFVYLFYKDDRHLQIGFEHTSYGGPLSPPIEIDYDVPHELVIEMGSLYPPREHPYWDAVGLDERERRKRTLRIRLDGETVLEGKVEFYDASPGHVVIGRNPISDAFGRRFSGLVRSVRRGEAK